MTEPVPFAVAVRAVSATLESLSDPETARHVRRDVATLRGIRGTPPAEVARVAAAVWDDHRPRLPEASEALDTLFGTAFEDGLVAIGLVSAALPDAPDPALELGLRWAERVDDGTTADALGWLVLGPGLALTSPGDPVTGLTPLLAHRHDAARRAAVAAGLAWMPEPVLGPAAAPLRARLGIRAVRWVDDARTEALTRLAGAAARDEAPMVRKAVRRLLRAWARHDPRGIVAWADTVRALPKMLAEEIKVARKRVA